MKKEKYSWAIKDENENYHSVVLDNSGKEIVLLIDDNIITNIHSKVLKFGFSYEYAFEVCGKHCVIVFIPYMNPRLAVNGVYSDNGRPYSKVHNPSPIAIALLILTAAALLTGIVLLLINRKSLLNMVHLIIIVCLGYIMRLFVNYPIPYKRLGVPRFIAELFRHILLIGMFACVILCLWETII